MEKPGILSLIKMIVLYTFILVFFSGCSVVGLSVPTEKRVTLVYNQEVNGSFKDGPLTVDYNYSLSQNKIKLSGVGQNTTRMDSLDIRVLFLDITGTVLQQTVVYSSGYRTDEGRHRDLKFDKTIDLPIGVVGISFATSGQARRGHR